MRGHGRTRALRLTVLAAVVALAGQSVLTHLHGVEESASIVGRALVAAADERSEALRGASSTAAQEHDRGECTLCVARAQSRSPLPVPAVSLVAPGVVADALAIAAIAPPARPAERTLTLRGPPPSA
jgi:hypothetical protein